MQEKAAEDFASAAAKAGSLEYGKDNDSTLRLKVGYAYHFYNFVMRAVISTRHADGGCIITPFSQLDRESLEFMRGKLIELGGKPPALPAEKQEAILPKFRRPEA